LSLKSVLPSHMLNSLILLFSFAFYLQATPNFEKVAQIIGKEITPKYIDKIEGYFDENDNLWIIGKRWYTKETGRPGRTYDEPYLTYLYFWLYDREGNSISEGTLGDSVQYMTFFKVKSGGALIVWRCETEMGYRLADPVPGYVRATYIDEHGIVKHATIISAANVWYDVIANLQQGIVLGLGTMREYKDNKLIFVENDTIAVYSDPHNVPRCNFLEQIDSTSILAWTWVDSIIGYNYDSLFDQKYPISMRLPGQIEIRTYDFLQKNWENERLAISDACFRKYREFDIFPLSYRPKTGYKPVVQSVKLVNGNIVITIFTIENVEPVAYQILFDSLGHHIPYESVKASTPKDIEDISEKKELHIKQTQDRRLESGKVIVLDINIWIWGYDRDDGELYWKKYFIQ
jgi:hypothetical protein